jgi:hypothetical protein
MKTLIIFLAILGHTTLLAQDQDSTKAANDSAQIAKLFSDMFNRKVDAPIDEKIFSKKGGTNMYFTADEDAFVLMMVLPVPIEKAEGQMENQKKKPGYKTLGTGSFRTKDGRKIIFENGSLKAEGKKMLMDTYGIETKQGDVSIFLSGVYPVKEEAKYKAMIKSLAEAAKLAE